jgi:hypothetical protein
MGIDGKGKEKKSRKRTSSLSSSEGSHFFGGIFCFFSLEKMKRKTKIESILN